MANANGIAGLAITLLLGSSVVFGGQTKCPELQETTLKLTGLISGTLSPIEYSNFDNPITFKRAKRNSEDGSIANAFAVEQSGKDLPQITVDGESYKLFILGIRLFDTDQGTANLVIIFSADGYDTPAVYIFIPIFLSETDDADLNNKQLTEELSALSNLPLGLEGSYTASVKWLKPLLEKAIRINRPSASIQQKQERSPQEQAAQNSVRNALYMTDCETVFKDFIFIQPVD